MKEKCHSQRCNEPADINYVISGEAIKLCYRCLDLWQAMEENSIHMVWDKEKGEFITRENNST
jgi:hypothetical protein